jgi:hypothetical protein
MYRAGVLVARIPPSSSASSDYKSKRTLIMYVPGGMNGFTMLAATVRQNMLRLQRLTLSSEKPIHL